MIALAVTCQPLLAEPRLSVKAAGLADKTLAVYFEADYVRPAQDAHANLQVETAKVIIFDIGASEEKRRLVEPPMAVAARESH
jgi:hypothetical protein